MKYTPRLSGLIGYVAAAILGAVLIELLIENGGVHVESIKSSTENQGVFSTLNDWLYIPAALIAIGVIWWCIDRRVPRWASLVGVIVTGGLVMLTRRMV